VLKGVNIRNLVRTVTIHESICSPYITAEILLLDNSNVITNMKLEGGDPCHVIFDAFSGTNYNIELFVLDYKGITSPENLDLKIYTISFVTSEYYTDRVNTVSANSALQQSGVELAQEIWKNEGFRQPLETPISDYPLQDGQQPFHVDLVKPFTAIGQMRDIMVFPDKTGNVLLYRDAQAENLVPLHHIYTTCFNQLGKSGNKENSFIQKQTWGTNYTHLFGGERSFYSIIDVKAHSRAVMGIEKMAAPAGQTKRSTDQFAGKFGQNLFIKNIATLGIIKAGQLGMSSFAATNSDRTSPEIDFSLVMERAKWYALCLKSQPQYLVKVPLQTGINITVGKGVDIQLLPNRISKAHPDSGLHMITDLVHEVHNDLRVVNGTTTFQSIKTGACNV
jgi:hypothetical protein